MGAPPTSTPRTSSSPIYVLGINAYDHDVSAALLKDGEVVVAISKERLTRVKHDAGFYRDPVAYCLLAEGITLDDVALVVRNSYLLPVAALERRFLSYAGSQLMTSVDRRQALRSKLFLAEPPKVVDISHHLAHAYSAWACSPFEDGACLVVDGVGSHREDVLEDIPAHAEAPPLARESESMYAFGGDTLHTLDKVWLQPTKSLVNDDFFHMEGLGALYSRVSSYIFAHWNRCGEVMGLAPFGTLDLPPMVAVTEGGGLRFTPWPEDWCHPYEGHSDHAWQTSPHRNHWQDMARRIQHDTEEVLLDRARRLHERTGSPNLTLAGGVALNCVANGRLVRETPFENVYIQPAAGDDGIAIGCALYGWMAILGQPRRWTMTHPYLGRAYDEAEVEQALGGAGVRLTSARRRPANVTAAAADLLAKGRVIGWFQGGSEFGPRALGNRSILADPRKEGMQDHVNARVKHRQGFRPFAPSILAEHADEYFVGVGASPFMLLAADVRPEKRGVIPAVTHVDGTARVQTVHRETNPRYHALLSAFHERTGVPVLLNTSFNDRGEPIVETPGDAVATYLSTDLDALVLHDAIIEKRAIHKTLRPFLRRWQAARQQLRSPALRHAAALQVLDEG